MMKIIQVVKLASLTIIFLFVIASMSCSELSQPTTMAEIDSDGDGWSDTQELQARTDPRNVDTDGDGYRDPKDANPFDPLINLSTPEAIPTQPSIPVPESTPKPATIPEPLPNPEPLPAPAPAPEPVPIPTPIPKITLDDIVLKSDELPSEWQPVSVTKEVGKGTFQMFPPNSSPINSLNIIIESGGSETGVIKNYILLSSKSQAMGYYNQYKELKDSNLTITDFNIGDGSFIRVVRGPRLELYQITDVEQFKDIVVKYITVCFTKGAYYVTVSSGPLELTSEKNIISLLQNLAGNVEKRVPAE